MRMNFRIASYLVSLALLISAIAPAAVRGRKAMYTGGTIGPIERGTKGILDCSEGSDLVFTAHKQELLRVPFSNVTSIEYGQHAGRRIRAVLLGGGWPLLFSHKRRHYLSIGFTDLAGNSQGAVFELAKHTVRTTLAALKARTGKEIEFDSEDAKKNVD